MAVNEMGEGRGAVDKCQCKFVGFFLIFFDFLSFEGIFGGAGTLDPPQSE